MMAAEAPRKTYELVGQSARLKQVMRLAQKLGRGHWPVLLLGETGTGKELVARTIHRSGAGNNFVVVDCSAMVGPLMESELFGHVKGAFTGAQGNKTGLIEQADGGTAFFDEIGELPLDMQAKLLRVLQEKEFVRVGGTQTISTDTRILAATNRNLQVAMKEGAFREDLYYRLNVFPIEIPPLRQRREDIPLLVDHFTHLAAAQLRCACPPVSDEAMALLASYHWPGNIRELQNVMERAVLLADGQPIVGAHLPREITGDQTFMPQNKAESALWGTEKALILKALKEAGWNQSKAARALGISRDNLRYRIKKYEIEKG